MLKPNVVLSCSLQRALEDVKISAHLEKRAVTSQLQHFVRLIHLGLRRTSI